MPSSRTRLFTTLFGLPPHTPLPVGSFSLEHLEQISYTKTNQSSPFPDLPAGGRKEVEMEHAEVVEQAEEVGQRPVSSPLPHTPQLNRRGESNYLPARRPSQEELAREL